MSPRGGCLRIAMHACTMVALLPFGGCGYKDKPVPPQHTVPKAVIDLQVELDAQGATLSWSYPRETVTGIELEQVDGFALYRAEIPQDSYCPTCPVPYSEPIAVPGGGLPPDGGRKATYAIRELRPGNRYFFKVRSTAGWWSTSQDSNEVSFFWQTPPMPPADLSATAGDGRNILRWQAVHQLRDGAPAHVPIRYQVYRGIDGGPLAAVGGPVATNEYVDSAVENGRAYAYQVRTLALFNHGTIDSGMSETVQAVPLDRTAPPVPRGVEGLRTEVGVKVYWNHGEAADLAGHRIYRRSEGETSLSLVGEVLLPYNMFIDTKPPETILWYAVSSIDARTPANESARSPEIRIER